MYRGKFCSKVNSIAVFVTLLNFSAYGKCYISMQKITESISTLSLTALLITSTVLGRGPAFASPVANWDAPDSPTNIGFRKILILSGQNG